MSVREYIGARYVPLFADPIEWDNTKTYEPLTIVYYQGNSYTSRQAVPTGIAITNETYWALTGNYNAQIEAYREEVAQYAGEVAEYDTRIDNIEDKFDANGKLEDNTVITDSLTDLCVTSGKLATAIQNKINLINASVYDSVADMISNSSIEDYAETVSYYAGLNKGGCLYSISDIQGTNGILLNSGKYANPIFDSSNVTPEIFGAYGDGVHDDTDAVTAAFDAVSEYGNVFLYGEKYLIDDTIVINKPYISVIGCGVYYKSYFTGDEVVFEINQSGFTAKNIGFVNSVNDSPNLSASNIAVKFNVVDHNDAKFDNCFFRGYKSCIEAYGRNITIQDCTFTWCWNALHVLYNATSQQTVGMILKGCHFHTCVDDLTTVTTWNDVTCFCMIVDSTVNLRGAIITECEFSGVSFIGFYKGPNGVKITNNIGSNDLGGAIGHVYITSFFDAPFVYANNFINNVAALNVSSQRDFLAKHLIYGYFTRFVVHGNMFRLTQCERMFENVGGSAAGTNYGISHFDDNVIIALAPNSYVFYYNTSTASGGNSIYLCGNKIRPAQNNVYVFSNGGLSDMTKCEAKNWLDTASWSS